MHTDSQTHTHTYTHTRTPASHARVHAYAHAHAHTQTHIWTHTHANTNDFVCTEHCVNARRVPRQSCALRLLALVKQGHLIVLHMCDCCI